VDKAYKCYFLGIDASTQAYIVWVIDLNIERISSNVLFDEATQIKIQLSNITIPTAPERRNIKDYIYLIGMVYRDDEDKLLYVTKRVVVQRGILVAYRCVYIHDVIGQEEPNPIHVADVERMLHAYLLDNTPGIVLTDDVSATKVEVFRRLNVAEPHTFGIASLDPADHSKSSAKHTKVDLSEDDLISSNCDVGRGVQRLPVRKEESKATTAHVLGKDRNPTRTTSHRFPRDAHNKSSQVVNVGKIEDSALHVQINYCNDVYNYNMSVFEPTANEFAYITAGNSMSTVDIEKWQQADLAEIKSVVCDHNVWDVCSPPQNSNLMTCKWVRTIKQNGTYKSRIVGRGFNMIHGVDYNETFAPVAKMVTTRIFLTLVAIYSLFTGALDIKTAFLNAPLTDIVWMEPPSNLYSLLKKLLVDTTLTSDQYRRVLKHMKHLKRGEKLRLLKALYGTKQASREWYLMIDKFLKDQGFKPNKADHCFYSLIINNHEYVLLLLYVDDIIIAATSKELTMKYVKIIGQRFRISFSGELRSYLNIGIEHDRAGKIVYLSQTRYIEEMIAQFEIPTDPSVHIPMQENLKLLAAEEESATTKQLQYAEKFPYRKLIGAIIYLNVCTRPAISYAISILAQFNAKPTFLACKALVRLAKYIFNTKSDRLALGGSSTPTITSFCDSDWGGCVNTRYSRSGHITFMGNGPVVWYSKRQTSMAQSSAEAEFMAKAPCVQNSNYCRRVVNCIGIPHVKYRLASGLFSDNESSIAIASNPVFHQRTKHISIKFQYVNENVANGNIVLQYIKSRDNFSDMFTKPVGSNIFLEHYIFVMGGQQIPRILHSVKTIEEDTLPCPICSLGLIGKDYQL
jgi:hypothetical protein